MRTLAIAAAAGCLAAMPATAAAVTLEAGDIIVADLDGQGAAFPNGSIIAVDPVTGQQQLISSNPFAPGADLLADPSSVNIAAPGVLSIVDKESQGVGGHGALLGVVLTSGSQFPISNDTNNSGTDYLEEPTSSAPVVLPGDTDASAVIADQDSQTVSGEGALVAVTLDPAPVFYSQSLLSSNAISGPNLFVDPSGIDVQRDGQVLVADRSSGVGATGALIRVDPATGEQTAVSDEAINTGADLFDEPIELVVADDDHALVTDRNSQGVSGHGALISVDLTSGQQTAISNDTINTGTDLFSDPAGVAVAAGRILVVDRNSRGISNNGAVIAVDPNTGEQSFVSNNLISGPNQFFDPTSIAIVPGTCAGEEATMTGTRRRDVVTGTPSRDVIVTLGGNDTIRALGGHDLVCGGRGRDVVIGGRGRDRLRGNTQRDRLRGGQNRDRLFGGTGNDRLVGGGHPNDVLQGGPGNDVELQ